MEQVEEKKNEIIEQDKDIKNKKNKKGKVMNAFASIFLVFGVLIGGLSLICLTSFLIAPFYYLALILIVIFTLGLIFAKYPNFGDRFYDDGFIVDKVVPMIDMIYPYLAGFSAVLFILSIILFSCNKARIKKAGIIISSIFFGLFIVATIVANVIRYFILIA